MKVSKFLNRITVTLALLIVASASFAQNNQPAPIYTWGSGLNGSMYQMTAIYSDVSNGFLIEAPKDPSGNKLNISINWRGGGTTPFFIQGSNGFVGLGTTTPYWKLHVKGAITAEGDGAGGYSDINLKNGAQRWHISGPRYGENNRLGFFWNDGTSYFDLLTLTTAGNVGIGTTTPSQKLDVNGNINLAGASGRRLFMGGVGGSTFGIAYDAQNPNYGIFYTEGNPDYVSISPNGNANNGILNVYGDGNVGIGSSGSQNKLQIGPNPQGWSGNDIVVSNSNANQISLAISNASDHTMLYGSGDIAIRPGFGKWAVYAKADGNVGIGTTDPKGYKLAVAGKTITEEVVVKLQVNWPDYVFEQDYKLPSLLEIEKFIKANKHLPEVPSAEEVKENGLSVGEMNAILLKKVEELTLHIINQEKRIMQLEKEK